MTTTHPGYPCPTCARAEGMRIISKLQSAYLDKALPVDDYLQIIDYIDQIRFLIRTVQFNPRSNPITD